MTKSIREVRIDAIRTIAICGVIATHSGLIYFGRFGVQLFFAITGYLIANLTNLTPSKFLIRRFFRLYPLFLFFLISILVLQITNLIQPSISELIHPVQLVLSFSMLSNLIPGSAFIAGSWSVSNEWIFSWLAIFKNYIERYFIVLFIFLISAQLMLQFMALKFENLTSFAPGSEKYWIFVWINTLNPVVNAAFFILGFGIRVNKIKLVNSKFICVLGILSAIFIDLYVGHVMPIWLMACYLIFSLCWNLKYTSFQKLLFNYVGRRTYGIFLGHYFIIELTNPYFPSNFLGNTSQFFVVLIAAALIGELTWRLIEKPSLKLSGILERKIH